MNPSEQNPGVYQVVVFLGLAGPVKPPPAPEAKPTWTPTPTHTLTETAAPATTVVTAPKFTC